VAQVQLSPSMVKSALFFAVPSSGDGRSYPVDFLLCMGKGVRKFGGGGGGMPHCEVDLVRF